MNLFQKWILGKKLVQELELKAFQVGQRYLVRNGRLVTPVDNKDTYITEGYNKNDIIYSVINLILDKVCLPDWQLFKVVDESKLKESHRLLATKNISVKDYKRALQLKEESLEPISSFNLQAGKLKELLKYSSEEESFQDHSRLLFLYKLLTGDYYEWGTIIKGGANAGVPNELYCLPSQFMNINVTDSFPAKASSYDLTVWNQKFTKQEILHEKYVNPNWDINGQQLYGFAPLRPFLKNITRNNSAKDSSTAKFQNGGVEEIIFIDDPSIIDHEAKLAQARALKVKLSEEYSGPANQGKIAVSGLKTGSVHLGNSPVELGIIDSEKWDAIMFCNGYGVPPVMMGFADMTYNNLKEAEKALTTRSAIPLLTTRRNSLNRKIQTDWGFKGVNIYVDYNTECFPELQIDIAEWMAATEKMIMVTPNEQREGANVALRPEPEADEPWVMSGSRTPLADYQANAVDEALMREQTINNAGNTDTGKEGNTKPNGKTGKERISYT